jgi:SAM-dependent methyltransferase
MSLRKTFFKYAWDTRCRNMDVCRVLARFAAASILDAGCGEYGLAAVMPSADITGVDILRPETVDPRLRYEQGSILELPFDDASFDVAASVDVLEHLRGDLRTQAVSELVRVGRRAVVIAFPAGADARKIDEEFSSELRERGEPLPEWLAEHLANEYPEASDIADAIKKAAADSGRTVASSIYFSEPLSVATRLRGLAMRSKYAYLAANISAGILLPIMPRAVEGQAYRSIILAEFPANE